MGRFSNYIARKVDKYLKRSALSDPNHWINLLATGGQTSTGVNVTASTAMSVSAVFACVRVISETIASLPLKIYKKTSDGKKEVPEHPLYPLLSLLGPTPWQTAPEFWEMQVGHNCLRGNAYAYKVFNGAGNIMALVPLNPAGMQVEITGTIQDPEITYIYSPLSSENSLAVKILGTQQMRINSDYIWHLKGISSDGFMGLSPLSLARESIGLAISAERHGSTYFKNAGRPSGIAQVQGTLKEDAFKRFSESINAAISGDNKFKALVLENGATWQQIGMSNEDLQFLETRNFQVEDIARIFRVPSILIQHPDKSSTYASAEQFMISFVTHTIRPWLVRIEKSITKNLLSEKDQKNHFAEFKIDGLLRGDIKSRYEAYAIAIQNKILNPNEARQFENLVPYDGGDEYENPNITVKNDENRKEDI